MAMSALTLNFDSMFGLTREQFYQLCLDNRDLRLERTAEGELVVMPPTGWHTGNRNSDLNDRLRGWNRQNRQGIALDSSTGFSLPNGADCSADAAWVKRERIEALALDPEKFLPLAPDFLIELPSATDNLKQLQQKMQEYIDNGARLGWPIEPQVRQVEMYRPGRDREGLQTPNRLLAEEVLPGFVLDLSEISY